MKWTRKTGIMLALDVNDRRAAFELLDLIIEDIDVIKLNSPLILSEGLSLISEIKDRYQKPIMADFEIADVPVTNNRIIRICREVGADGIMLHGFIGIDSLQSAIETAGDLKIFVVTQLTNPGGLDFTAQFTEEFAGMARMLGAAGVQAPGNRPNVVKRVRTIVGDDLMIVCCGIGVQGGRFGAAIEAGGDFEIIGRAIYQAEDPGQAVKEIGAAISPFL
ncbi:MAG: orotidine-5'-phosphate decarboxylase [Candidatus Auribacterota bacterium]|nr:orotidine-5'-phosphate decarboxylase [Candidatus Auribacterota bacterium]